MSATSFYSSLHDSKTAITVATFIIMLIIIPNLTLSLARTVVKVPK